MNLHLTMRSHPPATASINMTEPEWILLTVSAATKAGAAQRDRVL
jgi:hypothetical protein